MYLNQYTTSSNNLSSPNNTRKSMAKVKVSPVSIQTQSLALRKRKPQETQALALASSQSWLKISRNKRKRQPIGMLGRSSGNHDWLLALRFLRFSFTQLTQRKRLRLNGNRA